MSKGPWIPLEMKQKAARDRHQKALERIEARVRRQSLKYERKIQLLKEQQDLEIRVMREEMDLVLAPVTRNKVKLHYLTREEREEVTDYLERRNRTIGWLATRAKVRWRQVKKFTSVKESVSIDKMAAAKVLALVRG